MSILSIVFALDRHTCMFVSDWTDLLAEFAIGLERHTSSWLVDDTQTYDGPLQSGIGF